MKTIYRGFELEAKRENCLAGYPLVYYSAFRISDGWEMISSFSDSADTVRDYIKDLKQKVDECYENPEEWGEDEEDLD